MKPRNRFYFASPAYLTQSACAVLSTIFLTATAMASDQVWMDTNTSNNWNLTDTNWDTNATWVQDNNAIFGGTGETVTLTQAISAGSLTFNANSYTIAGNTLTLTGAQSIVVATGNTASFTTSIAGGTLNKSGAGIMTLNGSNTISTVNISEGTVKILGNQVNNRLSQNATITVATGATLDIAGTNVTPGSPNAVSVILNGGTLTSTGGDHSHIKNVTLNGGTWTTGSGSSTYDAERWFVTGDITVAGSANSTISGNGLGLSGARTFTVADNLTLNVTANLNNGNNATGSLIKAGNGIMQLGSSDYSGATTVNAGTLKISGSMRNTFGMTANSGAILELGSTNMFIGSHGDTVSNSRVLTANGGQILFNTSMESRIGNIALSNGGILTSNRSLNGWDVVLGNTTTGAATISVTGTGAAALTGLGGIHLKDIQNIDVANVSGDAGNDLNVSMTLADAGILGGTGGINKLGDGTMSLTRQATYTGGTTITAGTLSLDANGGGSGLIRGTVTVKTGATLRLNANDVTGYGTGSDRVSTINIEGGTMHTSTTQNQTLGSTVINMTGGAITGITNSNLDFFAGGSALNTLASDTTSTISGTKVDLRQSSVTFNVADGNAATDLEISSLIYGNALVKTGAGTMKLDAANTYSGNTTVQEGTLAFGATGTINSSPIVTVNSGAIIDASANGTFTVAASQTLIAGRSTTPATDIIGNLVNHGTLNVGGTGNLTTLSIAGNATLSGTIRVDYEGDSSRCDSIAIQGTLTINPGLVLDGNRIGVGTQPQVYILATGLTSPLTPTDLANLPDLGSSYTWDNTTDPTQLRINYSPGATLTWKGHLDGGTWDIATTANWLKNSVASTFADGDFVIFDDTATNSTVDITFDRVAPGAITVNNSTAKEYTFTGESMIQGITPVIKTGNGTLNLTNVNEYTGGTMISGGVVAFEEASIGLSGPITMNGGTLRWLHTYEHTTDISSRITLVNGTTATFDTNGGNVTCAAAIGNQTTAPIVKVGSGTLTLSGNNTYTGTTTIQAGTLNLHTPNYNTYRGGEIHIQQGSTLSLTATENTAGRYDFGTTSIQFDSSGGGAINVGANLNWVALGTWTFKTTGGAKNTITGISGMNLNNGNSAVLDVADGTDPTSDLDIEVVMNNTSGRVTKTGAGTATLKAASNYSGGTIINAGTLVLANTTSSATGAGSIQVNNAGSTLAGTGAATGAVSVQTDANISPGVNGIGNLSTGALTLAGKYLCDVSGTTADHLTINGNLNFSAGATIQFQTIVAPTADSYVLATYTGDVSGTPSAANTPSGYTVTVDTTAKEVRMVKATGYDDWASVITDPAQRGRDADPDGDGFTNQQEYLFGTSPIAHNGSLSTTEKSNGNLIIRWLERTSGASYQLKESATLNQDWTTSQATIQNDGQAIGDYQPKMVTISIGANRGFFRIEGSEIP